MSTFRELLTVFSLTSFLLSPSSLVAFAAKDCHQISTGLIPLTELGSQRYQGVGGGLYPDGQDQRPASHEQAGIAIAQTIQPLDKSGKPNPRHGKIVLLGSGMSNTLMEFNFFRKLVRQQKGVNPKLVLVNGAVGQVTSEIWVEPHGSWWEEVEKELSKAGVSANQVQVAWLGHARRRPGPDETFPQDAVAFKQDLVGILQLLKQRFPNLRLAYLSSRAYAGYAASDSLNPEPFSYHSGFAVKWLIEEQLRGNPELNYDPAKGTVKAPWLSWGPYLWADGLKARRDGLSWDCEDFAKDGIHPSEAGKQKVAQLLWRFFSEDLTTKSWFLA